jgi:hypothetical protein
MKDQGAHLLHLSMMLSGNYQGQGNELLHATEA